MTPAEALPLVAQMAAALTRRTTAGVIHRDFKSANVMLVPDERRPGGMRAVVTDFGLARRDRPGARLAAAPLTETEAVLGTPDYMAPEQVEGRRASRRRPTSTPSASSSTRWSPASGRSRATLPCRWPSSG